MNDETFSGSDLAPKPIEGEYLGKEEQLPGQQMKGPAPPIRMKQLYTVDPNWPCAACTHPHKDHRFLYGMGTRDRYRCEARLADNSQCDCGKQYMIAAMIVDPRDVDTDEKREEFIRRHNAAHEQQRRTFDV